MKLIADAAIGRSVPEGVGIGFAPVGLQYPVLTAPDGVLRLIAVADVRLARHIHLILRSPGEASPATQRFTNQSTGVLDGRPIGRDFGFRPGRCLAHEEATVPLKDLAATQRQNPGQRPVGGIQPGHLRERALRAAHHPPGVHVVRRLMPRADQVAVLVERAVGQVRTQVPTSARHREQFPADVPDRITSGANHRPGRQVGYRSHFVFSTHTFIVHPLHRMTV